MVLDDKARSPGRCCRPGLLLSCPGTPAGAPDHSPTLAPYGPAGSEVDVVDTVVVVETVVVVDIEVLVDEPLPQAPRSVSPFT
ncbi:MAG: hypothetical protein ACE5D3_03225, partial [Candidatus Binatia bacterium]